MEYSGGYSAVIKTVSVLPLVVTLCRYDCTGAQHLT